MNNFEKLFLAGLCFAQIQSGQSCQQFQPGPIVHFQPGQIFFVQLTMPSDIENTTSQHDPEEWTENDNAQRVPVSPLVQLTTVPVTNLPTILMSMAPGQMNSYRFEGTLQKLTTSVTLDIDLIVKAIGISGLTADINLYINPWANTHGDLYLPEIENDYGLPINSASTEVLKQSGCNHCFDNITVTLIRKSFDPDSIPQGNLPYNPGYRYIKNMTTTLSFALKEGGTASLIENGNPPDPVTEGRPIF